MLKTITLLFSGIAFATAQTNFVPITPCRVVDTRNATGTFGGPLLAANVSRSFAIPTGPCTGIPSSSTAYVFNVTLVPPGPVGYLTAWPTGVAMPLASIMNDLSGAIQGNAATISAGTAGAVSFYATNTTHLVLDLYGYYIPTVPSGTNYTIGYGLTTATVGGTTTLSVNSAVFPRIQSLVSGTATANQQTATGNPQFTNYTSNTVFIWTPGVNCTGSNDTLNIDGLGALALQILVNGVAGPTVANSCTAGEPIIVVPTPSTASGSVAGASGFILHP